MINREYIKICNAEQLTTELIAGGLIQHPNIGARFYGVSVFLDSVPKTIVHCYDDITQTEPTLIDTKVNAHIPV